MKKQSKKLVLHRETLRHLDSKQLGKVNGGDFATCGAIESTCTSCISTETISGLE